MVNVEAWLKCLGLEQYAEAFAQNGDGKKLTDAGVKLAKRIGNCYAPGIIGAAIWNGYRYARELDAPPPEDMSFKREFVRV